MIFRGGALFVQQTHSHQLQMDVSWRRFYVITFILLYSPPDWQDWITQCTGLPVWRQCLISKHVHFHLHMLCSNLKRAFPMTAVSFNLYKYECVFLCAFGFGGFVSHVHVCYIRSSQDEAVDCLSAITGRTWGECWLRAEQHNAKEDRCCKDGEKWRVVQWISVKKGGRRNRLKHSQVVQ